jgi:hypothetical protein
VLIACNGPSHLVTCLISVHIFKIQPTCHFLVLNILRFFKVKCFFLSYIFICLFTFPSLLLSCNLLKNRIWVYSHLVVDAGLGSVLKSFSRNVLKCMNGGKEERKERGKG